MSPRFHPLDRDTPYLVPPSLQDWLPEGHLARFVVEMVDALDLSELEGGYEGRGKTGYHPAMLVALLFYGYATGVFSSRKLEQATYGLGGDALHRGRHASGPRHDCALSQAIS